MSSSPRVEPGRGSDDIGVPGADARGEDELQAAAAPGLTWPGLTCNRIEFDSGTFGGSAAAPNSLIRELSYKGKSE
jgi:hypothetical protein